MKDLPWINLYYPKVYDIVADYISGYDPSGTWFYDTAELYLNTTKLAAARPDRDPNTLIYAVAEPLWVLNPMFIDTCTDELSATLCFRTLYKWSVDPFPTWPNPPDWQDYIIKPDIAADYPTYLDNGTRVRVPLRPGMVWSDGWPITASDVKWTYDAMMDPPSRCTGRADFTNVIDSVEIVDNLTVDFNLKYAYPDILSILSNDWGTGCILPSHFFGDAPIHQLKNHQSNWDFLNPSSWMPTSGPFRWDEILPDDHVTLVKNPDYYGYALGWGPYNIDKFILTWIKDPADRLMAVLNNDVDLSKYPIAPVQTFQDMINCHCWSNLIVVQYYRPASNPIWLNFNNQYLSNRYIRMAIAHAIDYNYIVDNILPSWGIETGIRGKTPILPHHYYTDPDGVTVHLFNEDLPPHEYNVAKAQQFMDLWYHSQVGTDWTLGPVGDAEFDTDVDIDDFYIWRDESWLLPFPRPFLPGQDIDADFDNDVVYHYDDFVAWRDIGWPKGNYP